MLGCIGKSKKEDSKHHKDTVVQVSQSLETSTSKSMYLNLNLEKFKENLGATAVPIELEKLIDFQTNISAPEFYSRGFAVTIDDKGEPNRWSYKRGC
ncbi:hypothetical protein [Sphingobacterium hungaricum]|uniref:Uncharacterized protein n=1 Tax=Sphingobacterium hungaricum TaxID=2082723 RepID=A0A928UWJ3_9SPHI|nr:hypothetical protein [Sphingobacterium hungaricum]MBE8712821.1 hypothetical protein [Sphingobacterium hungaricum]